MGKLNAVLLILTTWSAFCVVDLRLSIQKEVDSLGKGKEKAIRLAQDYAELQYERSGLINLEVVNKTVSYMGMREPKADETVVLQLKNN